MKTKIPGYCAWLIVSMISACGGIASTTSVPGTTATPTPTGAGQVCGQPAAFRADGIFLASAAALQTTITVDDQQSANPSCSQLIPRQPVTLHVGDRVEFVANGPPRLDPPATDVVALSTAPGPAEPGPGAGLLTAHVIVTLTAVHAGSVVVGWVNCSGTAC